MRRSRAAHRRVAGAAAGLLTVLALTTVGPLVVGTGTSAAQVTTPTDLCAVAGDLLEQGRYDDAAVLYQQLTAATSGNLAEMKSCGEQGLAKVASARLTNEPEPQPVDRARSWWESFLDDFLTPAVTVFGQAVIVAMVGVSLVKLLGLLPVWQTLGSNRWAALSAVAVALVTTGFGVALAWGEDAWVDHWAWLWWPLGGLALAAVLMTASAATNSWRATWAAIGASAVLVFDSIWLFEVLNDDVIAEEWVGAGLVGASMVAAVVALAMVQSAIVSLQFGAFKGPDDTPSEAFAAATQAEFFALGKDDPRGISRVRGTDQTELPADAVTAISPSKALELVLRMLRAFTPSTKYKVTGQLQSGPDSAPGGGAGKAPMAMMMGKGPTSPPVGVTLTMRRAFRSSTTATITSSLFSVGDRDRPALRFASSDLATAAAAWVQLTLMAERRRSSADELSGATQWESVALQAVAAQEGIRPRTAVALLARATDLDPGNRAARFGWASDQLRALDRPGADLEGWRHMAAETHDRVTSELESLLNDNCVGVALRLRVLYGLAASHLQRCELPGAAPNQAEQGSYYAQWVVHLAQKGLRGPDVGEVPPPTPVEGAEPLLEPRVPVEKDLATPALKSFLNRLFPVAVFAWAGAEVIRVRTADQPVAVGTELLGAHVRAAATGPTTPRSAYNQSCLFCAGDSRIDVAAALLAQGPAETDQAVILEKNLRHALGFLKVAVQDPALRDSAPGDPSLQVLATAPGFSERFRALTTRPAEPEPAPPPPQVHHVLFGTLPKAP